MTAPRGITPDTVALWAKTAPNKSQIHQACPKAKRKNDAIKDAIGSIIKELDTSTQSMDPTRRTEYVKTAKTAISNLETQVSTIVSFVGRGILLSKKRYVIGKGSGTMKIIRDAQMHLDALQNRNLDLSSCSPKERISILVDRAKVSKLPLSQLFYPGLDKNEMISVLNQLTELNWDPDFDAKLEEMGIDSSFIFEHAKNVETLNISGSAIKELPSLPNVKAITIKNCRELKTIKPMPKAETLDIKNTPKLTVIEDMDSLLTADFSKMDNLQVVGNMREATLVNLNDNPKLIKVRNLPKAKRVNFERSAKLKSIGDLSSVESLKLEGMPDLNLSSFSPEVRISILVDRAKVNKLPLSQLFYPGLDKDEMASVLNQLTELNWDPAFDAKLKEMGIDSSFIFENAKNVETLNISGSAIKELPSLPNVKAITIENCHELETINPMPKAETLDIKSTPKLTVIENMDSLLTADFRNLKNLQVVGNMRKVTSLKSEGMPDLDLSSFSPEVRISILVDRAKVNKLPLSQLFYPGLDKDEMASVLNKLTELNWDPDFDAKLEEMGIDSSFIFENAKNVETLKISGSAIKELPSLPNVKAITIENCHELETINPMPKAETLDIKNNNALESLDFSEFSALKKVKLENMNALRIASSPLKATSIRVGSCPKLTTFFLQPLVEKADFLDNPVLSSLGNARLINADVKYGNCPQLNGLVFGARADRSNNRRIIKILHSAIKEDPSAVLLHLSAQLDDYTMKNGLFKVKFLDDSGKKVEGDDYGGLSRAFITQLFSSLSEKAEKGTLPYLKQVDGNLVPVLNGEGEGAEELYMIGRLMGVCTNEKARIGRFSLKTATGAIFSQRLFDALGDLSAIDRGQLTPASSERLYFATHVDTQSYEKRMKFLSTPFDQLDDSDLEKALSYADPNNTIPTLVESRGNSALIKERSDMIKEAIWNKMPVPERMKRFLSVPFTELHPFELKQIVFFAYPASDFDHALFGDGTDSKLIEKNYARLQDDMHKNLRENIPEENPEVAGFHELASGFFEQRMRQTEKDYVRASAELNELGGVQLEKLVQGEFSKEHFIQLLKFKKTGVVGKDYAKNQEYIKRWINETPEDEVKKFLEYISGSRTLGKENIEVALRKYTRDGGIPDYGRLPIVHTCSNEMEAPVYPDYETFKERFETAIAEGLAGSGFTAA